MISKLFNTIKRILFGVLRRINTEYTIVFLYPRIYKKYARMPVDEKKVIFIESRLSELSNSFHLLYDKLYAETDFSIKCHFLRKAFASRKEYNHRCLELIKDMATAKYIFLDEATHIFSRFTIRPETVVTQLWHGCGAFKKFGYSTEGGTHGSSKKAKERYPTHKNYSHVTVSSPEVIWAYEEAMRYPENSGIIKATGISRTDIFYDNSFVEKSYNELYNLFPAAKNKKVILYAPTFRGNVERASAPDFLDLHKLKNALADKYVIIIKHHPLVRVRPEIDENLLNSFAVDFTDNMSIESLLCVSDICISDYSSLIYEFSLFEKPLVFLSPDLESYFDSRGFYYDYNELTPGPVFSSNEELIKYISEIDTRFNKRDIIEFREKFMSSCDGNATARIIDTVFGESFNKYKKSVPLPKDSYHIIHNADSHQ